ncbi:MAG: hypothetical protein ACRDK2_05840 [Solirubrobacteraceae bacterium]
MRTTSLQRVGTRRCARPHPPLSVALLAVICLVLACLAPGAQALARAPTTGFLSDPTDQIAVPGLLAGAEITPEGDLYTGWAEYELRYGRHLESWNQPTRTLSDPSLPLLSSTLSDGPVHYTQTIFAVPIAGRPVAYETVSASNASGHTELAQVAMAIAYTRGPQIRGAHGLKTGAYRYERPVSPRSDGYYDQPGQAFSSSLRYSTQGRDLDRSGLLLARGPAAPSRALSEGLRDTRTALHDRRLFSLTLKAHAHASFTWQIPLDPPPATPSADAQLDAVSMQDAQTALERLWGREEAGMMGIVVPEAKVSATYRAAITEILASRYQMPAGWVQATNKLQYQAFWIRDAAIQTEALDLAGLHQQAAQNLAFMDTFQQPNGLFISRAGQYDGLGQALWALDEHAQLTQDPAYAAAQLPRIQAALDWLSAVTATDPMGLEPAGNPHDDELAHGHITGDDLWAGAGLRSAIADARLAGRSDLVAAWQALDGRFQASLKRAITLAVRRAGHIPPVLDAPAGQDWGNYDAAYPVQVLAADSPAVKATMAWARAHTVQGLPTYENGRSLHDYLGFSVFETELEEGDDAAASGGLYSELTHTTSTDNGWELGIAPFGHRGSPVDMTPHGTFAGDYVALLRNMLVSESAGGVDLLDGASAAWLAPGQHITVTAAPTDHGVISFTERSSAQGETLTWSSTFAPGIPLSWTLPAWARDPRGPQGALNGRRLALRSSSGSLTVTFGGRRPAQSYALAVKALNAEYRAHSRPEPLVSATR